jgi:16S rRNA processing protein RimM
MTSKLILVGRVSGAFGVRGEVRISTYTEDPLALGRYKTLLRDDGAKALTVTSARVAKGGIIARCPEITTKEQADALRGLRLHVHRDSLPAPTDKDEFYLADLIGLSAATPEGEALGKVKAVHNFGAGDILEIDPGSGRSTLYLPFTYAHVPQVEIAEGRIVAILPVDDPDAPSEEEAPE